MLFERLRDVFRTLRFRLMAWNTGVVLLMVLPTLFLVREGFRRLVHVEFDRILAEDINEIKLSIRRFYPNWPELYEELRRRAQSHAHHGWFVQIFHNDGSKWQSLSTPDDVPELESEEPSRTTADPYLLVQDRLSTPTIPTTIIRVGSSLKLIQEDVRLLTQSLVLVGVLITFLAPLGGYWLSGRAIRPLAKIIHKTSHLRPSNLAERLPIRGTGDELDQLSQTINGLLNRIARYLEQKGDFLANAAHELRSPLAAIRSLVEVALNSERTPEEYVALLIDIMEECTSLSTLVNQLLLLAEGDAGRLALHPHGVRLDQVVRKSLAMFEGVAESVGIRLEAPSLAPLQVGGDENHLRQVINNLVDNAIKFTAPGGRVLVEVAADADGRQALLRVSDTGSGIAKEEVPRIFERFYRSDKSRHHEDGRRGTGLGLAICQSIVSALQGIISVDSIAGQGSCFSVRLPLYRDRGGAAERAVAPAQSA
jgi:signal transduction histidine kinase